MRADKYLYEQGYADSRTGAALLIRKGVVFVDGVCIAKPSAEIDSLLAHKISVTQEEKYVGRGGYKLEAALDAFHLSPEGLCCLDIGASTGGFTDCLLSRGARCVIAVDSGHGQLHPRIANDERVESMEGVNARYLAPEMIPFPVSCAVMDVSFISQTCILPALVALIPPSGWLISLIKPQFEVGRHAVGKNGIVRSEADRISAIERVLTGGISCGLFPAGLIRSPITGGDGNTEYLVCFYKQTAESMPSVELLIRSLRTDGKERQ